MGRPIETGYSKNGTKGQGGDMARDGTSLETGESARKDATREGASATRDASLSGAVLRIGACLDQDTVLREVAESVPVSPGTRR